MLIVLDLAQYATNHVCAWVLMFSPLSCPILNGQIKLHECESIHSYLRQAIPLLRRLVYPSRPLFPCPEGIDLVPLVVHEDSSNSPRPADEIVVPVQHLSKMAPDWPLGANKLPVVDGHLCVCSTPEGVGRGESREEWRCFDRLPLLRYLILCLRYLLAPNVLLHIYIRNGTTWRSTVVAQTLPSYTP